jgi:hypothetical protein
MSIFKTQEERATEERKVYTAKILFPVFLFGGVH